MSWIKMNTSLWDNPKVVKIAETLDIDEVHVVGCLYMIWSWADKHTEDGNNICVTKRYVDKKVNVTGFADAMLNPKVGWLLESEEGISIPNFEDNNGQSAKKRAETAKRVANHRAKTAPKKRVVKRAGGGCNNKSVTTALPREDKRREDKNSTPLSPPGGASNGFDVSGRILAENEQANNGHSVSENEKPRKPRQPRKPKTEERTVSEKEVRDVMAKIVSLNESWKSFPPRLRNTLELNFQSFDDYPFELVLEWQKTNPRYTRSSLKNFLEDGGITEKARAIKWKSEQRGLMKKPDPDRWKQIAMELDIDIAEARTQSDLTPEQRRDISNRMIHRS